MFILIFTLLLSAYILVPALIWRSQIFSAHPQLRVQTLAFLPEDVQRYFEELSEIFLARGFVFCFDAMTTDYSPSARVFIRMYKHPEQKMIALAMAIVPQGATRIHKKLIEMISHFSDGFEIVTHTSDLGGAPLEPKTKTVRCLPSQTPLPILITLHQKFSFKPGKVPEIPKEGEEPAYLEAAFRRDLMQQAALGGLWEDEEEACFKPTWAGALIMSWYTLWPIGPLRRFLRMQKAKLWLRGIKAAKEKA